jgi:hypothetical protein
MNDIAPQPDKRASLIALLKEAGKSILEIDAILAEKKYALLSDTEKQLLSLEAKPAEPAEKPLTSADAKPKKKPAHVPGTDIKSPTGEAVDISGVKVQSPFSQVVGEVEGQPVTKAQAVANEFMHKMVDFCKAACGPEWYAAYRAIKYPDNNESLATPQTKLAAYTFAFETVLKLKLSVLF